MIHVIQTNFTAGELSPRLAARVDFDKYANGCSHLGNFLIHPHGGASRRPGLRFVAESARPGKKARLAPFQFSTAQAYVLEWGDRCLRVYKDGGQVLLPADQAAAWASGAAYAVGDMVRSGSPAEVYRCLAAHPAASANEPGAGADWAASWVRDPAYELATPYAQAELPGLAFCQSADVMYVAHAAHPPMRLSRTGHAAWSLEAVAFTSPPTQWKENNHPALVMFYEQRLCFAGAPDQPQTLWMSRSGSYHDFGVSDPLADSDACSFTLVSNQVNAIRWMVPARRLLLGTSGAEWELGGSGSEAVTPFNVNAQRHTTHGSKDLDPVAVGNIVLYVQRNGRRLREFAYSFESDGFVSGDMTLLAEHLTHGSQLGAMAYQQDPDSVVWCLREDGLLMGLSYMRDQKVYAWHRHPTAGAVESLAVIPGDGQDELWVLVRRTVNGQARRYVERLDPQFGATDTVEAFFVDSGLTYDGRNRNPGRTLALSAPPWTRGTEGTLTAAGFTPFAEPPFDTGGAGQAFLLQDPATAAGRESGSPLADAARGGLRVRVLSVDGPEKARVRLEAEAPDCLRGPATPAWSRPVDELSGLTHLAGETVHILADGAVEPARAVSGQGTLALAREASVIHAGLPYASALQTMNLELAQGDGTAQGRVKRVGRVVLRLYKSLGGAAGFDEATLDPLIFRTSADPMGRAPALSSGDYEMAFPAGYDTFAHVRVVQDQPLPLTVLALITGVDVLER